MEANNNQKIREALELCIDEMCNRCRANAASQGYPKQCLNGCEVVRKVKAALAAPLRNCDVGTEKEQSKRFDKFCYDHRTYERGCGDCPLAQAICCEFAWAQMPYSERGAE